MTPHVAMTRLIILGLGLGLTACTQFEPFQRQGTWHENQAPMQNIAIELANPADLYRGSSRPILTGNMAANAIDQATIFSNANSAGGAPSGSGPSTASPGGSSAGAGSAGVGGIGGAGMGGSGMSGSSGGPVQ